MQAASMARRSAERGPAISQVQHAVQRLQPGVQQARASLPADNKSDMAAYAARDHSLKKIAFAAQLHQSDSFTQRHLVHFSKTLTESIGAPAEKILPIFQELWAIKELRSRYLERQRSMHEQRSAAESAKRRLKDRIAHLELEAQQAEVAAPDSPEPSRLAQQLWVGLGLTEPHVPSASGRASIGGVPGIAERMKMRLQAQMYALQEESFRAGALLREFEADEPRRAIEAVAAAKEKDLQQQLSGVLEECERCSLQLLYDQRSDAENLEALA